MSGNGNSVSTDIDALMSELKIDIPTTKGCATALTKSAVPALPATNQKQTKSKSSWDDDSSDGSNSDDEEKRQGSIVPNSTSPVSTPTSLLRQQNDLQIANPSGTRVPLQEKQTAIGKSPCVIVPCDHTRIPSSSSYSENSIRVEKKKAAVAWPALPKGLQQGPKCPLRTCRLVPLISVKAQYAQNKILHCTASGNCGKNSLGSGLSDECEKRAYIYDNILLGEIGRDDDLHVACPYIYCSKCSTVVVRLQQAYFTNTLTDLSLSTLNSILENRKRKQRGEKNSPVPLADAANRATAPKVKNSFDEDTEDDDENVQIQENKHTSGDLSANDAESATHTLECTPEEMYIYTRYHYPDWSAFPKGILRRLPPFSSTQAVDGSTTDLAAAAYHCQCSYASVVAASNGTNGAIVLEAKGVGLSSITEVTFLSNDAASHDLVPLANDTQAALTITKEAKSINFSQLKWECQGHFLEL